MNFKRFVLLISLLAVWTIVIPAAAQSSLETFTSQDGSVTFSYPSGWFVSENQGSVTLQNSRDGVLDGTAPIPSGQGGFMLFTFSQNDNLGFQQLLRGTTVDEKLQSFVDTHPAIFSSIGTVDTITIGEHPAAFVTASYADTKNDAELVLIDFENGGYGFVLMSAAPRQIARIEPKMRSIISTIQYTPLAGAAPSPINVGALVPINALNAANLKRLSLINAHSGAVSTVAISPDSQTIASGGDDNAILFWDVATGQQKPSPEVQSNRIQQLLFTPDGSTVISAGDDGTVRLWDVASARQQAVEQQDGSIWYIAVSPDGSQVAYISYISSQNRVRSSTVWLWNLETGSNDKIADLPNGFFANSITFSPDGKMLLYCASGNTDLGVWLVDVASRNEISHWSQAGSPIDVFFTADSVPMVSLTSGLNSDVILWNPQQPDANLVTLSGHGDTVYQTILNPSRTIISTPSFDGTARLWDLNSGDMLVALPHNDRALGIAFSADGRLLVTSDANGAVYVWGIVANI